MRFKSVILMLMISGLITSGCESNTPKSPIAEDFTSSYQNTNEPHSDKTSHDETLSDEATSDEATSDEATSDEATSDEAISDEAISDKTTDGIEHTGISEDEFWDYINSNISDILKNTDFVIYQSYSYLPYIKYSITTAIDSDEDGVSEIIHLPYDEYISQVEQIKSNLHNLLDEIKIEKPKSIFSEPTYDILWIEFHADGIEPQNNGLSSVGTYQVRIVDYYYDDEFVQMDHVKEFVYS